MDAKQHLDAVVKLFESDDLPKVYADTYLTGDSKPISKWSRLNKILCLLSGTVDARGCKQWGKVGRHPKKGSKAIYILAPKIFLAPEEKDGKPVLDSKGEPKKFPILTGFKGIPVFRYEDTDGSPLKAVHEEPKQFPPLTDVAESWGATVRWDRTEDGELGSFSLTTKEIRLCTEHQGTFFHELAHLGHSKIETLRGGQCPEQEAVAQLTAAVLGRLYGFKVDNKTYHYVKAYAGGDAKKAQDLCLKVIGTVEKVLGLILAEAERLESAPKITVKSRKK